MNGKFANRVDSFIWHPRVKHKLLNFWQTICFKLQTTKLKDCLTIFFAVAKKFCCGFALVVFPQCGKNYLIWGLLIHSSLIFKKKFQSTNKQFHIHDFFYFSWEFWSWFIIVIWKRNTYFLLDKQKKCKRVSGMGNWN